MKNGSYRYVNSSDGVQQGDPFAPFLYCLGQDGVLKPVIEEHAKDITAFLFFDDNHILGKGIKSIQPAVEEIARTAPQAGFVIRTEKSKCNKTR